MLEHWCLLVSDGMVEFQAKSKQEEKDAGGPRLNEQIRAEFVRIVTDEGLSFFFLTLFLAL